ncbi:MAG: 1-deoxy-D-xylulose-5-phosphate synthase [Clostridia bacterium]|nr:1-deoxy-D-xylulose-5-phosphate synthase [Clostridia bacterium]
MKYLDKINYPNDLKKLKRTELETLCQEIRDFLIDHLSLTGGHLSSNLGVVELTVAMHYIFNAPEDKFIFDVSHQCYIHKILTGRKNEFNTLRQDHGLSGFTNRDESKYDTFTLGHSSTSIAMATGLAIARDLKKEENKVIAVIGDGSLTGGLAYEGLNNINNLKSNIIVILNDNDMSISKSVGALTKYLNRLRSRKKYFHFKANTANVLNTVYLGKYILKHLTNVKRYLKYHFVNQSVIFENFGFKYIGPIDGNDISSLLTVFDEIKNLHEPILLHVKTQKGKGYSYAENNPTAFHGVGKFEKSSGIIKKSNALTYSKVAGNKLLKMANKNKDFVVITAAMMDGTGIAPFERKHKDRFFDVGIAEEYAVSFSAGISRQGLKPIFLVYSTFIQRAYDQIIHDICLNHLFAMFLIDRAGIVGEDGKTHQGIYDIAMLSNIPNLLVLAPRDTKELENMIDFGISQDLPIAIRYPKGSSYSSTFKSYDSIRLGKFEILSHGKQIAILGLGAFFETAEKVYQNLKERGFHPTLINPRFAAPIDKENLKEIANTHDLIITLEDGILSGGFASKVTEFLYENGLNQKVDVLSFGFPKDFIEHGKRNEIIQKYALDVESITNTILSKLGEQSHFKTIINL